MRRRSQNKKFGKYLKAAIVIAVLYSAYSFFSADKFDLNFSLAENKKIFLTLDGMDYEYETSAQTITDFFQERNLEITENDYVYPDQNSKIFFGSRIYANKARKMIVSEGGSEKEFYTLKTFIGDAVREKKELNIGEYDIIQPEEFLYVTDGIEITVTHVEVKKETEEELIAFKTIINEDDELGWREKKVTQKGVKGINEVTYEVIYHDGKEIKRKEIDEKILKEPISEIVTKGTYVKLGSKVHTGFATWYDQGPHPNLRARYPFEGDMFAANPWLPLGSYAKVTNKANGKSVIVRINDRGPFGENRILDLNKPAFAAIASIGAGIIDIKMEEIKN